MGATVLRQLPAVWSHADRWSRYSHIGPLEQFHHCSGSGSAPPVIRGTWNIFIQSATGKIPPSRRLGVCPDSSNSAPGAVKSWFIVRSTIRSNSQLRKVAMGRTHNSYMHHRTTSDSPIVQCWTSTAHKHQITHLPTAVNIEDTESVDLGMIMDNGGVYSSSLCRSRQAHHDD